VGYRVPVAVQQVLRNQGIDEEELPGTFRTCPEGLHDAIDGGWGEVDTEICGVSEVSSQLNKRMSRVWFVPGPEAIVDTLQTLVLGYKNRRV